jgi:aldehyde:ferredoxin oxidoreductase
VGEDKVSIADPERLKALRKEHLATFRENDLAKGLSEFGTPLFYDGALMSGDTPVKNWSGTRSDLKDPERITADKLMQYKKKPYACSNCPIGCGGILEVKEGKYRTTTPVHKAEYETMGMLGPNLLNENVESLIKLNDLCNRLGMDTIGCGGLCAFAIECFENGIIDSSQTDDLQLTWGNTDAIIDLVEKIGKSKGIGAVLAKGFAHAVQTFGPDAAKYVMAVGNEGLPAHDPRWSIGLALTYYTDPTPARHTQGSTTFPVAGYSQPELSNDDPNGRGPHHKRIVNLTHALSSAGLCLFGFIILDYRTTVDFLSAVDGHPWTLKEFEEVGFRINMARNLFNRKAGVNFRSHKFPKRVLGDPPLTTGPTQGVTVNLATMVDEYLAELGLDPDTLAIDDELLNQLELSQYQ